VEKAEIRKLDPGSDRLEQAIKGERRVNYDELGYHLSAIYERDLLPLNTPIPGPAIIEEPAATTVVFPDQQVRRDEYGFLHIEKREGV
jgi:N-methylhydantoinase A